MGTDQLFTFANSQGRGYLKPWKAHSIVMTLATTPAIKECRERLRKYLAGCLEMEGFADAGIDAITDAIFNSRDEQ